MRIVFRRQTSTNSGEFLTPRNLDELIRRTKRVWRQLFTDSAFSRPWHRSQHQTKTGAWTCPGVEKTEAVGTLNLHARVDRSPWSRYCGMRPQWRWMDDPGVRASGGGGADWCRKMHDKASIAVQSLAWNS